MKRPTGARRLVRAESLLVRQPTRHEKVKRRLKRLLRIVKERVKPIPSRRPQRTGRVDEARKCQRHNLVGSILQRHLVHCVCRGIVQDVIALDAAAEAPDAAQIRLDVCAPLRLGPRRPTHLETNRGIRREGRGASGGRSI